MENALAATSQLHLTLKALIERKTKRDGVPFSIYQLAHGLDMPRSILVRLMHPDPYKRVTNPRIDTLLKIVSFFKADGFDITLDDLLTETQQHTVEVNEQTIGTFNVQSALPLYSFDAEQHEYLGTVDIHLTSSKPQAIALRCDEDIKPMFKKGSIFILDKSQQPEDDTLVAVKIAPYKQILIRKYYIVDGHRAILKSYNPEEKDIILLPTLSYQLLGVVVQINAKT